MGFMLHISTLIYNCIICGSIFYASSASVKAIQSASSVSYRESGIREIERWMHFWICLALAYIFDMFLGPLLELISIYIFLKIGYVVYLLLWTQDSAKHSKYISPTIQLIVRSSRSFYEKGSQYLYNKAERFPPLAWFVVKVCGVTATVPSLAAQVNMLEDKPQQKPRRVQIANMSEAIDNLSNKVDNRID